jgi:hypothetical protein
MKWNKQFEYPKSMRSLINDERHYEVGTEKLPSVTTILAATQSDEKRESLAKWKAKVGDVEADRIKNTAATRGTFMHSYLEHHLNGQGLLDLSDEGQAARNMAQKIIDEGLKIYKKYGAMKLSFTIQIYMQGKQIYVACIKEETVLLTLNNQINQNEMSGSKIIIYRVHCMLQLMIVFMVQKLNRP